MNMNMTTKTDNNLYTNTGNGKQEDHFGYLLKIIRIQRAFRKIRILMKNAAMPNMGNTNQNQLNNNNALSTMPIKGKSSKFKLSKLKKKLDFQYLETITLNSLGINRMVIRRDMVNKFGKMELFIKEPLIITRQ